MPGEPHGISCTARLLCKVTLLVVTLLSSRLLVAQETLKTQGTVEGKITLLSESEGVTTPEGISLELKPLIDGRPVLTTLTDAAGRYEFKGVKPGDYLLRLQAAGFEPFSAMIRVTGGATIVQNISAKLTGITQKVEVTEQTESVSTSSSSGPKLTEKQLAALPLVEENFKAALPLTPGVVRTPEGKLNFRGSGEEQSMLQVNDAKMTDPVTGSFSIPVPLDAVQSVRVEQTPYSAENGGFSGGLTVVETVPPPERWKFGVRDLNVSLRGKNDHFVGVARATPRIVFGGPLLKDKLSFSEVFEYDVIRDPVRGLAWPRNEIKRQGFTSYSTLQAIISSRQVVTATLNVFPLRTQFANINALVPQTASSDYDRKGVSASLSDVYNFSSGALFRMALTYTRFDGNAHGQGSDAMQLTPEGWGGNFFNSWTRSAGQVEAAPTFQFAPKNFLGRHEFKTGADVNHRSFRGRSLSQDVRLLREDGTLAEQIGFGSPGSLRASDTDAEVFVTDHWTINDGLAADLGGRLTTQSTGRSAAFAPRFGVAYAPGKNRKTIFRAGTGLFYDRVPMLAEDFAGNPTRLISQYDAGGQLVGSDLALQNDYIASGSGPLALRIRHSPNTSARSFVSNAEVNRALWSGAFLKLEYLHSRTDDLFVINPITGTAQLGGVLGLFNTGRENYDQADATLRFHPIKESELNVSYILSRSRGDLNTLADLFIPFEQPVIRPNLTGVRPSDIPNRLVAWGTFKLPFALTLGPIVDVHTGFPYSKVDELQNYVGIPNSQRFPTFFSVDCQVYRDFRIPFKHDRGTRKIRLGFYVVNLTNHGNFDQIYNNVTSPEFGRFAGFERQKTAFLLSVVN